MEDIPVFLFTGFLDAGKTSFIESLLEDKEFNNGQPTLVIQCEEGEEELAPDRFPQKGKVNIVTIDGEDRLTEGHLLALTKQYKPARIIVEYNGMWLNNVLFQALPESWSIAGETLFFDSTTFAVYNANMRQLVVDKLRTAELVLFNRVTEQTDKMALHKIVRAITRQADIAYSYDSGKTEYDEIVDPLPFDVDAPIVKVEDKDYALFYQDLVEDFKKYHGKVVEFTALVARNNRMPKDTFVAGRQLMQCCAADIQFAAFAFKYDNAASLQNQGWYKVKGWYKVTAKIEVRYSAIYGKKGPVFNTLAIEPWQEPEEPVATFY